MTALELAVMRRKRRRTHLLAPGADVPLCGTRTALTNASCVVLPLVGGATYRLRVDLVRELDDNTCIHCARIGVAILALYAARDKGRPW
jgi:hypothetical protein